MQIIVIGAGSVGSTIAKMLYAERHEIVVIERDSAVVEQLRRDLDALVIEGSGSDASKLFRAGAPTADLCLAVTSNDEVNLLGAHIAKVMGTRRAVARVYSSAFQDYSTFDYQRHFNIDRLLSLERLTAMELAGFIHDPGTISIRVLGLSDLEIQEVEIREKSSAVGVPLSKLRMPKEVRVGSIRRNGRYFIPRGDAKIEVGDYITLIGNRDKIEQIKDMFELKPAPRQGVVIAGGGEVGRHLAHLLAGDRFAVVVLESDRARCDFLEENLGPKKVEVLCVDAKRRADLEEEQIGSADFFVACMGDDEDNIVACVEALELGVPNVLAVINRVDYTAVTHRLGITQAVSPYQVVTQRVRAFLNTGPVVFRQELAQGSSIHILEVEIVEGSPLTEHRIGAAALPKNCLIAAYVREGYTEVPGADDKLMPGDKVVVLVDDASLAEVLDLFRPRL